MMTSPILYLPLLALALYIGRSLQRARRLPPGPKSMPIVGNILDLPAKGEVEFQHWLRFKDKYGPISSVTVLGQTIVLLHDKEAAVELLSRQSAKSSSRNHMTFASMCQFDKLLGFLPYNARWRRSRKMIQQQFVASKSSLDLDHAVNEETRRFLSRLLKDPQNLVQHIRTEAGAIILKLTYGYSINQHRQDPLVASIEEMMDGFSRAILAGSWLVDLAPWLRYLPAWLPGMGFKTAAKNWRRSCFKSTIVPYAFVRDQVDKEKERHSFVSTQIEQATQDDKVQLDALLEDEIMWAASSMYGGGADTTVGVVTAFFLAMVLFPQVQKRAQEEIDAVIGSSRLPEARDEEQLPYISAVAKEALRWFPVGPMGLPHCMTEDFELGGYLIPKGSMVLPAIWWFLHDPAVYARPLMFEPERFLSPQSEPHPAPTVFGFGRRICPGNVLAEKNLFCTLARVLAVFDVRQAVDAQGRPKEAKLRYLPSVILYPAKFPFDIVPRSSEHARLIEQSVDILRKEEADDKLLDFQGW